MGLVSGIRNTLLPAKGNQTNQNLRVDDYGNLFAMQGLPASLTAALEGSLFVARHAPLAGGSGLAIGITAAFVDTTPALVLTNAETTGGKTYLPLYIRGRVTAAGSTTTSSEVSVEVDNTNRFVSGGTSLTSLIACTNPANTTASKATLVAGAITAAAAGTQRRFVGSAIAKVQTGPDYTINDVLLLTFGATPQFTHQAQVIGAGTTVETIHLPFAGCAVPPGGSLVLNFANVANVTTAPSFEFEVAWIER